MSSAFSIRRHAFATAAARCWASVGPFGRHRLHGRKPARSASSGVEWKRTLSRRAGRAAQVGRQYTPVVRTE
jgi:hypothetical protein